MTREELKQHLCNQIEEYVSIMPATMQGKVNVSLSLHVVNQQGQPFDQRGFGAVLLEPVQ